MNSLCHVNCCNNQGVIAGVTYHKFPKTVAELWFSVHNIPIRKVDNVCEMIVCSDHFRLEDYTDTKLKNGAVPSLYLKISKDDATEPNITCFSSTTEDKSCIELPFKADINQINTCQLPAEPDKLLNVLQNNNSSDVVEKLDKSIEFTDIITITDESDIRIVINSMHNYSISDEQPKEVRNDLLSETHNLTGKKASCFKSKCTLRSKEESIKLLRNRKVKSRIKNKRENTCRVNDEELIENIILDHDYTLPDDVSLGGYNGTVYNLMCSENYVWKLKKQLGKYSRTTRALRKRLDSLKSTVDVLKNRIL